MISVIVPVYKVEKYLRRCVDSILAQTFTDFELILVDDGSPDCSGYICDVYSESDDRIHVIHKANGGLSDARNAGIEWALSNSNSEWITFVDSDDCIHPQYLELLYDAVKRTGLLISSSILQRVSNHDIVFDNYQSSPVVMSMEDVYTTNGTAVEAYAPGRLYKKDLWKDVRFPVGKLWEDIATTYKVLFKVDKIAFVPASIYYYYVNPEGITTGGWTPKKLEELEAYEVQLKDKRVCHNRKVFNVLKEQYIWRIDGHIGSIEKAMLPDREKSIYRNAVKKKLRISLLKYSKGTKYSFQNCKYLYELAFPQMMWFYYSFNAQIRKVRKK